MSSNQTRVTGLGLATLFWRAACSVTYSSNQKKLMVKLNSEPDRPDGELALWLDGKLVAHFVKGVKRTRWTGMGFALTEEGGEPFEGFRWRTSKELTINFFWLLLYVTEHAARQNKVANPNPVTRVWFDDIVVATRYIGPLKPR